MYITEAIKRIQFRIQGKIVHLKHTATKRKGIILLSYSTTPFLTHNGKWIGGHTNYWEACTISEEFLARGYDVDVVDFDHKTFLPKKKYSYVIDAYGNLERFASVLPHDCVKILYTMTSHWSFNNTEEYKRLYSVFMRKGVLFTPERLLAPSRDSEFADYITYGTDFQLSTYNLPKSTKTFFLPISTTYTFAAPAKDFVKARSGFVWLGGAGVIHKGLDLLVEAFASMPACTLEICGKHQEPLFEKTYTTELSLPSIIGHGMVDLGSSQFEHIRTKSAFIISASCAEGHSGAVIIGMHAGLIPIVNKESGIDVQDFGFILEDSSVESIQKILALCSALSPEELLVRATKAWEYANTHHTREIFAARFKHIVDSIEQTKIDAA